VLSIHSVAAPRFIPRAKRLPKKVVVLYLLASFSA
jgi:hypothetical protein